METMITVKLIAGAGIGAVLGFAWYKLVGCPTGACPITSHPLITTLYGAVLGILITME